MEVKRAETAGFCMGVVLALQKLDGLLAVEKGKGRIFTLGPIIHNPQVMEEYARKGVAIAESAGEIPAGATAVIRAHGVPKEVQEDLVWRGVAVVDATCPKVKKAQLLIHQQAQAGRVLLLFGEESHPEVRGLLSYAEAGAFLFDTKEKLGAVPIVPEKRYCLAAQTTQDRGVFDAIVQELSRRADCDLTVLQTICDATRQRQEEAVRIARDMEFMVVVGGYNSGNTRRLVQVVAAQRTPVLHVETAGELPLPEIGRYARVGLTAGASTPNKAIDEVHQLLATL
ncbi:MAG: 4-hydroxy-3-methylbut-2-enyl diphosphate reductase [Desulfobacteraceae bacterium]|nr:4-hydroxy-3-methylbut-2-enyl diphosphate reductase [Desulfobacteraceae bacterium]